MNNATVQSSDSSPESSPGGIEKEVYDYMRSPPVYCCKSKCFEAPKEYRCAQSFYYKDVPCNTCQAYGFCHCGCVNYSKEKEPVLPNNHGYVFGIHFCCPLECFSRDINCDEVDGIACKKCKSYCYCRCGCKQYMQYLLDNHCCPKLCIDYRENGLAKYRGQDCLLCEGDCRCLCINYQKELLAQNNLLAVRINGKLKVCVIDSNRNQYCCSRKCFKVPQILLHGIACPICNHINYCQCQCITFKLERKEKEKRIIARW